MNMRDYNEKMLHIPSKRDDLQLAAEQSVDGPGFLITSVEQLTGLAQARSLWPVTMGLACCAIEMMGTGTPRFDMARFGWEVFRASPRHADVMIVSGRVSHKMAPIVRNVYDSMPEPKWVISMGACASAPSAVGDPGAVFAPVPGAVLGLMRAGPSSRGGGWRPGRRPRRRARSPRGGRTPAGARSDG